ncbi:MAG: hypothetical protein ACRDVP_07730 [Acidimicrobiales bacterium]
MEPDVASVGVSDLHDLVARMREAIGSPSGGWAPKVLQAMLRAQSVHPLVPRAVLQALLPGLVTVARRLSWGSGGSWTDGGAFFADLTTTAWEVITEWKGQDRPYALLDLLSATRCRMRRQILNQRRAREITLGVEYERHLNGTASVDSSDLELLARAIDESSGKELESVDAAVLYGVRVLGLSMTDLAKLTGRSRRYLSDRRTRAETQLAQIL